jgi:hypothetical protein
MKKLLLLVVFLLLGSIAAYGQDCTGAEALKRHIYHPDRLVPTDKGCITVTGTIIAKMPQDDGDIHYRLKLNRGQGTGLINSKNDAKKQHRFLIFEPICVNKIKDNPAARRACRNFRQDVILPNKGDKISVTGIHMLDKEHGWLELHPVTKITVLR